MNTPIVDFVKKYSESNALRLHMPGHKGKSFLGCEQSDITEIDGADVLYSADGIIAQSQKNASMLFDTQMTFYSAEGSSLCMRAMIYLIKIYALQNGKKPIIAAGRNAHKTFMSAAALLDLDVKWLFTGDENTRISCAVTAEYLDKYLQRATEKPTAVYITSPDYLGNVTDIKALKQVCLNHDVLLIVDNAHGAYLKFLPEDIHPITQGADMCCDSAHKTLPVLTGGAYLHINKQADVFFAENAQRAMGIFASTSPSYLILQSLDMCNKYITEGYREKLSQLVTNITKLKIELNKAGYRICGDEPLKISIETKSYGYTGYELYEVLLSKKIVCEFADPDYVVMMLTPETDDKEIENLKKELLSIEKRMPITFLPPSPLAKKREISLNEALFAPREKRGIDSCIGKTSASFDASCPPAIPIVLPGEIIDENAIQCFKYYKITNWFVVK